MTERTKIILLINPDSPTGKLIWDDDIEELRTILNDFPQALVVSDEVYDKFKYIDESTPGIGQTLFEKTISIFEGGK